MVCGSEYVQLVERLCVAVNSYVQHVEQWCVSINVSSAKKKVHMVRLFQTQHFGDGIDSVIRCYSAIVTSS
jgi:hypothetical protein